MSQYKKPKFFTFSGWPTIDNHFSFLKPQNFCRNTLLLRHFLVSENTRSHNTIRNSKKLTVSRISYRWYSPFSIKYQIYYAQYVNMRYYFSDF